MSSAASASSAPASAVLTGDRIGFSASGAIIRRDFGITLDVQAVLDS